MAATSCLYFCFANVFAVDVSASRIMAGANITLYRMSELLVCKSHKLFSSTGNQVYESVHGMLRDSLDTLLRGAIIFLLLNHISIRES